MFSRALAAACLGTANLVGVAHAQIVDQPAAVTASEGVQVFQPAFFDRFKPVTAFDMVRQLPGFAIEEGEELRGFGATAGNVLINGKRPSSKDELTSQLQRISAADVLRIELIGAAATGGVDVRGYSELANVVLRSSATLQESTTYDATLQWKGERVNAALVAARTWEADKLRGNLGIRLINEGSRETTDITDTDAAGVITSRASQFGQQQLVETSIYGSLNWTPTAQDSFGLNARITPRLFNVQSGVATRTPTGVPMSLAADDYVEKDIVHLELGGDYERVLSPESSFKLITVNRLVNWRPQELFTEFDIGGPVDLTRINQDMRAGEHVLRGLWRQQAPGGHALELGFESAFNYRDTNLSIASSQGGGPFLPLSLPVASTKVEEQRYEAFVTDTWRVSADWTLELGFTQELSTISQSGDAVQERDFSYPKPRAIATWMPTQDDQLRLTVERRVAQLDFSEFASNISLVNSVLTVGNPDLEPEQSWASSLFWKRRLGERGSVSMKAFYDQIDNAQDFVLTRASSPACDAAPANDPACVFTAAGNIGDGKRYGLDFEATLPLDILGISGGLLKSVVTVQDSEVTDPVDGRTRRIGGELPWTYYFEFRQDIPEWNMAWGWDYFSAGPEKEYRLDEIRTEDFGEGDLDLFIESSAVIPGVLVRLSANNIFDPPSDTERRFFAPNRLPGGAAAGTQYRVEKGGPTYSVTLVGSF